jgi:hypothetical protein
MHRLSYYELHDVCSCSHDASWLVGLGWVCKGQKHVPILMVATPLQALILASVQMRRRTLSAFHLCVCKRKRWRSSMLRARSGRLCSHASPHRQCSVCATPRRASDGNDERVTPAVLITRRELAAAAGAVTLLCAPRALASAPPASPLDVLTRFLSPSQFVPPPPVLFPR